MLRTSGDEAESPANPLHARDQTWDHRLPPSPTPRCVPGSPGRGRRACQSVAEGICCAVPRKVWKVTCLSFQNEPGIAHGPP